MVHVLWKAMGILESSLLKPDSGQILCKKVSLRLEHEFFSFFTKRNNNFSQSCLVIFVECFWESCCCQSRLYLNVFSNGGRVRETWISESTPPNAGVPNETLPETFAAIAAKISLQHLFHHIQLYNCISIELWWIDSLSQLRVLQLPDINKDHPSTALSLPALLLDGRFVPPMGRNYSGSHS